MGDREVRAGGGAMIDRLLDSLACNATSTGQWLIDPLLGGATRLLSLGPYETAARYAEAAARIAAVNSGANCQSGIVGQARVVQARAALGRGDSVRASVLLGQALPALTYGLGARQPATQAAVARRDSIGR